MVELLKMTYENGNVSYLNLDQVVEVDMEGRELTFSNGESYVFNGDSDADWNVVMKFVKKYEVR